MKTIKINIIEKMRELFTIKRMAWILLGSAILSFGMYNIHQQADITEGGVFGMNLLVHHWFGISVAFIAPVLDLLCYSIAFKHLGKKFLVLSGFTSLTFAGTYKFWEVFPPVIPNISDMPFLASVLAGLFVGVGVGLIVKEGSSSGGDDALALIISKKFKLRLSRAYMLTDFVVLGLSLSYIPVTKILFSVIAVTISSKVIELIQNSNKLRSSRLGVKKCTD